MRCANLAFVAGGLGLLFACGNEQKFVEGSGYALGDETTLSGRVCDPERNTWLEGASVYTNVIADGRLIDTRLAVTDDDGRWTIDGLYPGLTYTIYVQHGNTTIDMFDVTLTPEMALDDPQCGGGGGSKIAVVTGEYDDLAEVLENLGYGDVDVVNGITGDEIVQFFSEKEHLESYDIVLIDGGSIEEDVFYDTDGSDDADHRVWATRDAIRAYVGQGGKVLCTDWAYDVIETTWPARIDFFGDDEIPEVAQQGADGFIDADVVDDTMAENIGADEVRVEFGIDVWPVMMSVDDNVTVYLRGTAPYINGMTRGDVDDAPLLVGFDQGDGRVYYSSFILADNQEGEMGRIIKNILDR
jgi:hypothetical protein